MKPSVEPIAILGYSVRLPQGLDSGEKLYEVIKEKRQVAAHRDEVQYPLPSVHDKGDTGSTWKYRVQRGNYFTWDEVVETDSRLLRIPKKDAKFMSVLQAHCLEAVWRALEDAGIRPEDLYRTKTGVFVAGYEAHRDYQEAPDDTNIRGVLISALADKIGFFLGTHGPSIMVESACSSSLAALSTAVAYLRKGDCDTALVVTVSMRYAHRHLLMLQAVGVLSESGYAHPFDEHSEGMGRAEGVGCVVLRRMGDAHRDGNQIVATLINAAVGAAGPSEEAKEGAGRNYEATCAAGIHRVMATCYEQVGIPLEHVRYLEAHATGTTVGDKIEVQAIARTFRASHDMKHNPLRIGSVKGNIGHAEQAAGFFSFIKAVEMARHRTFLPTGGLREARTDVDWVANNVMPALELEPFPKNTPVVIGVNSFGLGGGYAHAAISEYPCPYYENPAPPRPLSPPLPCSHYLLPLAAASEEHLSAYEALLADFLEAHPDASLRDLCGTFAVHRSQQFRYKRMYVASSPVDLVSQLRSPTKASPEASTEDLSEDGGVAMVFTGQGAQWVGVGQALLCLPVYRRTAHAIDEIFTRLSGWSLLECMASLDTERIMQTQYAQPVTFLVQIGLLELFKALGVGPSVVMGHSAGEVPAAYAAGLLTLEEAVGVVYHRSQEQQKLAGSGRMLAVGLSEAAGLSLLSANASALQGVEIACVNSPSSIVFAGKEEQLTHVKALLPDGTFAVLVPGNIAFHCALTQPIVPGLKKRLSFLDKSQRKASLPFISTVTGDLFSGPAHADYWVDNVRHAVKFQQAVETLCRMSPLPRVVLELGPHKTLCGPLLQTVRAVDLGEGVEAPVPLPTLKRNGEDVACFLSVVGELCLRGFPLRLADFYRRAGYMMQRDLPGHPLLRTPLRDYTSREMGYVKGLYEEDVVGPHAGSRVGHHGVGITKMEVSESACPKMMEHAIGGNPMLPGSFYLEAVLEAAGGVPCVLTDVEFTNTCPIPKKGSDKPPSVLSTALEAESGGRTSERHSFRVCSTPLADLHAKDDKAIVHCQGRVLRDAVNVRVSGDELTVSPTMPAATSLQLKDIGKQGLEALRAEHSFAVVSSCEEAYSIINADTALHEYGPSFQLIQELHMTSSRRDFLARLSFPGTQDGDYTPQLLDAMNQIWQLDPDREPGVVYFNGGYDVAYYLRSPPAGDVFVKVHRVDDQETRSLGRVLTLDNIHAYDSEGRLLLAISGTKAIWAGDRSTVKPCTMSWQPYAASSSLPSSSDSAATAAARLAELTACVAEARRTAPSSSDSKVLVRVLHVAEDATEAVDALSALAALPALAHTGVLVELYSATHSPAVLEQVASATPKHLPVEAEAWLRPRRALLPAALNDLKFFSFDVLHLSASSLAAFAGGEADKALRELRRLAAPGALLLYPQAEGAFDTAVRQLVGKQDVTEAQTTEVTVTARLNDTGDVDRRTQAQMVVVTEGGVASEASSLSSFPPSTAHVPCGATHGLDEAAWLSTLTPHLTAGLDSLVFLAGMHDTSALASRGYYRLLGLFKALATWQQQRPKDTKDAKDVEVWVVTQGCFSPAAADKQVRVGQASLYAVSRHIETELVGVTCRYADVDSDAALPQLAALIASRPSERTFRLSAAQPGPLVQRYFSLGDEELRCVPVTGDDDKLAFHAEVVPVAQGPMRGQVCLRWVAEPRAAPKEDEVTVQIKAAGLNFRDVLLAMSMLPVASLAGSAVGKCLGMEASGIVTAVGSGVTSLKVGDHVVTMEPHSFASFQNVPASRVYAMPESMAFDVGSTTLGVYNTVHHALINLARVRKGERVLIHSAAGGVGQAALSVCQFLGAEIYATASSAKRSLVESLGVAAGRIFDSRSHQWFDDIMTATGQQGVHVVLNSLAGKHQQLGLEALAPNGRFLEIGKMDVYKNSAVGQTSLCKNGSFFAIDMDRLAGDDPVLTAEISHEVFAHLSAGHYRPVPVTSFSMDRLKDAMDLMRSGKHVGKIALLNQGAETVVQAQLPASQVIRPDATYLVTGGAGGFGSRIVDKIVTLGATRVVVTVSSDPSRVAKLFAHLTSGGRVTIDAVQADLSVEADVAKVVELCRETGRPPLRGIFHCSGFSHDVTLADIAQGDLEKVAGPKNYAAMWLHEKTLDLSPPLEVFACVSSTAADLSSRYFLTYGPSNAMLNSFVRFRRALGLPASALNMTSLKDVGIVAKDWRVRQAQHLSGWEFITSKLASQHLLDGVLGDREALVQWQLRDDTPGYGHNRAAVVHNIAEPLTLGAAALGNSGPRTINTPQEVLAWLIDTVQAITHTPDVPAKAMLSNCGLDSFSFLELSGRIKGDLGVDLPTAQLTSTTTIEEVVDMLIALIGQAGTGEEEEADKNEPRTLSRAASVSGDAGVAPRKVLSIPTVDASRVRSIFDVEEYDEVHEAKALPELKAAARSKGKSRASDDDTLDTTTSTPGCLPTWRPACVEARVERRNARLRRPEGLEPMSVAEASRWFSVVRKPADARQRAFVFPSAGGDTAPFSLFSIEGTEIVAVIYPGKPGREHEAPIRRIEDLSAKIAQAMERMGYLEDKPNSLLAHCAGFIVAFEAALVLKKSYGYTPQRMVNISMGPPQYIGWLYLWRLTSRAAFQKMVAFWLFASGGASTWSAHDPEVLPKITNDIEEILLWARRQDVRVKRDKDAEKVDCPIHVMRGDTDLVTRVYPMKHGWSKHTTAGVTFRKFPGQHYFCMTPSGAPPVCRYLSKIFRNDLGIKAGSLKGLDRRQDEQSDDGAKEAQ